jgi:hypothetical protein
MLILATHHSVMLLYDVDLSISSQDMRIDFVPVQGLGQAQLIRELGVVALISEVEIVGVMRCLPGNLLPSVRVVAHQHVSAPRRTTHFPNKCKCIAIVAVTLNGR